MAKTMGRPVKWTEEKINDIAQKMDDHFQNAKIALQTDKEYKWLPTLEGFAVDNDVDHDYLTVLAKKNENLARALKRAKSTQKHMLVSGAISGKYQQIFAIFAAKNMTDMRDKVENEITLKDKDITAIEIVRLGADGKKVKEEKKGKKK